MGEKNCNQINKFNHLNSFNSVNGLNNFVQIVGVTDPINFPIITAANPNTQFTVEETLCIPKQKPDVEQINTLLIEAVVTNTRNIITPTGLKVVIDGFLRQKVIYTADLPTQSVHSAHFEVPFCTFIDIPLTPPAGTTVPALLASLGLSLDTFRTGPVFLIIEDVDIDLSTDQREVEKCAVIFAYTTVSPLLVPFLA